MAKNKLRLKGKLRHIEPGLIIQNLYDVARQSNGTVEVDLSGIQNGDDDVLLPLCAQIIKLRDSGIKFHAFPPQDSSLADLLWNSNILHYLDPDRFDRRDHFSKRHFPFRRFTNGHEQHVVVSEMMERILSNFSFCERTQVSALEWCLSELTDNVITHSGSKAGGLAGLSVNRSRVTIFVADAGFGVARTLREANTEYVTDTQALLASVQERVTRDRTTNQGNGLFGSYRCALVSGGWFRLVANAAIVFLNDGNLVPKDSHNIPIDGTYIRMTINFDDADLLRKALVFDGQAWVNPRDHIEVRYFDEEDETTIFPEREVEGMHSACALL
jgi:hypothetical protein